MDQLQSPPSPQNLVHVFYHEGMLAHNTGTGVFDGGFDPGFLEVLDRHPENSDRVRNMVSILRKGPVKDYIEWHSGRRAEIPELLSFHTPGVDARTYARITQSLIAVGLEFCRVRSVSSSRSMSGVTSCGGGKPAKEAELGSPVVPPTIKSVKEKIGENGK